MNVEGTRNLCEIALNSSIKSMVIWSSGTVYGIPKQVPVKETDKIAPVNKYEKSKEFLGLKSFVDTFVPPMQIPLDH